jgi:AcrR family transcriptional regulator
MSSGLRERKKAETRTALQDTALRLADRHGVDRVSIEAIAEAVGVSPRTFFNYFTSKEDAILGISPTEPTPLVDHLRSRPVDEAPLESVHQALLASTERLQEDPDRWVIRRRLVQRHPELAARYAARLADMEQDMVEVIAGRLGLDPDRHTYPATVVSASMAATRVAMSIWQTHDDPTELVHLIDEVFATLAAGLPAPPPSPPAG